MGLRQLLTLQLHCCVGHVHSWRTCAVATVISDMCSTRFNSHWIDSMRCEDEVTPLLATKRDEMVAEFDTWLEEQENLQRRCENLAAGKEDGTHHLEELVSAKSPRRSRHRI
eukprot:3685468-Amphidinium_carterae.1